MRLSELLERAHAGDEAVIARAGTPSARLVPVVEAGARAPVSGFVPPLARQAPMTARSWQSTRTEHWRKYRSRAGSGSLVSTEKLRSR